MGQVDYCGSALTEHRVHVVVKAGGLGLGSVVLCRNRSSTGFLGLSGRQASREVRSVASTSPVQTVDPVPEPQDKVRSDQTSGGLFNA